MAAPPRRRGDVLCAAVLFGCQCQLPLRLPMPMLMPAPAPKINHLHRYSVGRAESGRERPPSPRGRIRRREGWAASLGALLVLLQGR